MQQLLFVSGGNMDKKKQSVWIGNLIILVALCVIAVSGFQLFRIFQDYSRSNNEYESIQNEFTTEEVTPAAESKAEPTPSVPAASVPETSEEKKPVYEDAEPPLAVDWESLRSINPDIVGWIYVDAEPSISYPILKGRDNDQYLHTTFRNESRYAGSIFMDFQNSGDWSDPNTLVYGHNMRNGSMFGRLKFLKDEAAYREHPYFWILTPNGNYRYRIYSVFQAAVGSEVYTLYLKNGPEFLQWEKNMKAASEIATEIELSEEDHTVILSTCTSDTSKRCVVIGKCVSSQRPNLKKS